MDLTEKFKALADPTRRRILALLQVDDLAAGAIADEFDISKPSISHHLRVLKQAGLVTSRRDGQRVIYAIDTTVLQDLTRWMLDFSSPEHAETALEGGNE